MIRTARIFAGAEDGAVTVDWVLLTGAVVLIAIAVTGPFAAATAGFARTIASLIGSM